MDRYTKYKIALAVLSLIVIVLSALLIRFWPKKKAGPPEPIKGKIAIVIDDWGYNLHNLHFLDEIKYPLTISILPNLVHSREVAHEVEARALELILHLPLEPMADERLRWEKDTIRTDMKPSQIKEILLKDINSLPSIKGVSNHMGSKATGDLKTMRVIFQELKKRRLYFLDNLVSHSSICPGLAADMGMKFGKRDIFLDNEAKPDYIRTQIGRLRLQALRRGYAIAVGHNRKLTLHILKEVMPELEREGFEFVFVSELVQ